MLKCGGKKCCQCRLDQEKDNFISNWLKYSLWDLSSRNLLVDKKYHKEQNFEMNTAEYNGNTYRYSDYILSFPSERIVDNNNL